MYHLNHLRVKKNDTNTAPVTNKKYSGIWWWKVLKVTRFLVKWQLHFHYTAPRNAPLVCLHWLKMMFFKGICGIFLLKYITNKYYYLFVMYLCREIKLKALNMMKQLISGFIYIIWTHGICFHPTFPVLVTFDWLTRFVCWASSENDVTRDFPLRHQGALVDRID